MTAQRGDWLALGRDLIARGLGAPLLIVADGARPVRPAGAQPPKRIDRLQGSGALSRGWQSDGFR
jgi:hypothetical protein